jgi:Protein of unknown function (DUF2591)
MKIKTSELTGPALDWAALNAAHPNMHPVPSTFRHVHYCGKHNYSTDWAQGGPIIEREKIKTAPNLNGTWLGQIRHTTSHPLVAHPVLAGWTNKHGPTPLIAAMRCFVASKLGDVVEVPDELI